MLRFVHVGAAAGWMAALVAAMWLEHRRWDPARPRVGAGAPRVRGAAWAAYAALWTTGVLAVAAAGSERRSSGYGTAVAAKLMLGGASGAAFQLLALSRPPVSAAWLRGVAVAAGLAAVVVGVRMGDAT